MSSKYVSGAHRASLHLVSALSKFIDEALLKKKKKKAGGCTGAKSSYRKFNVDDFGKFEIEQVKGNWGPSEQGHSAASIT